MSNGALHWVKFYVLIMYSGNFHQALDKYRQTHEKFPESKEVLQYLVRLCNDMNMDKELKGKLKVNSTSSIIINLFK